MQDKQISFQVMEWHRGEFIPVKTTDAQGKKGEAKIVKITQESADELNRDFSTVRGQGVKIKYVEVEEKAKKESKPTTDSAVVDEELKKWRVIYEDKMGKKPYYAWSVEELQEKMESKK